MTKKNKAKIVLIAIGAVLIITALLVIMFATKKMETEKYSISVPLLYFDAGDDCYSHILLANDIELWHETASELSSRGFDIKTEEEYLTHLIATGKLYANREETQVGDYSIYEFDKGYNGYTYRFALYVCQNGDDFWCICFSAASEDFEDLKKDIPKIIESFEIKN